MRENCDMDYLVWHWKCSSIWLFYHQKGIPKCYILGGWPHWMKLSREILGDSSLATAHDMLIWWGHWRKGFHSSNVASKH